MTYTTELIHREELIMRTRLWKFSNPLPVILKMLNDKWEKLSLFTYMSRKILKIWLVNQFILTYHTLVVQLSRNWVIVPLYKLTGIVSNCTRHLNRNCGTMQYAEYVQYVIYIIVAYKRPFTAPNRFTAPQMVNYSRIIFLRKVL